MDEDEFSALCERIENSRDDAEYNIREGREGFVSLSTDDCDEISQIITQAFGAALMGKQLPDLADQLAILAGAFRGNEDED